MKRALKRPIQSKTVAVQKKEVEVLPDFNMSVRGIPQELRDRYNALKSANKTMLSMNAYIKNAWLEQLKRDEQAD